MWSDSWSTRFALEASSWAWESMVATNARDPKRAVGGQALHESGLVIFVDEALPGLTASVQSTASWLSTPHHAHGND